MRRLYLCAEAPPQHGTDIVHSVYLCREADSKYCETHQGVELEVAREMGASLGELLGVEGELSIGPVAARVALREGLQDALQHGIRPH